MEQIVISFSEETKEYITELVEKLAWSGNGDDTVTFEDMFAEYPSPLYADRTTGARRIVFKDAFKTHTVKLVNGKPKTSPNEKGVDEYVLVHNGVKFPAGDAVWCWFKSVPINLGDNVGWEVCGIPGNIIVRRDTKVLWSKEDVDYILP